MTKSRPHLLQQHTQHDSQPNCPHSMLESKLNGQLLRAYLIENLNNYLSHNMKVQSRTMCSDKSMPFDEAASHRTKHAIL